MSPTAATTDASRGHRTSHRSRWNSGANFRIGATWDGGRLVYMDGSAQFDRHTSFNLDGYRRLVDEHPDHQ